MRLNFINLKNEALIDIATFLARCWSENINAVVKFSDKDHNTSLTKINKNTIILPSITNYAGSDFQKYRQFRTMLWYGAMRLRFCEKVLSNDHAFGFILNTMETRRVEILGRRIWSGMDEEIIFNYAYIWNYRPIIHNIYHKVRIIEAFHQYFLIGDIKGDINSGQLKKITDADKYAKNVLSDVIKNNYNTSWIEKKIPSIIKILDVDSLLTIPIQIKKNNDSFTDETVLQTITKISNIIRYSKSNKNKIFKNKKIHGEYKQIIEENTKNENKKTHYNKIGVKIPYIDEYDDVMIRDVDLINKLKIKFKKFKTNLKEEFTNIGDEFDCDSYLDNNKPFFRDNITTIKTKIMILLDHSSSIYKNNLEYKKAALALCEVLSYLQVKFSVYAFNTTDKEITCWLIKSDDSKWDDITSRRLSKIEANGGTPLAEVYNKMRTLLNLRKPDIFLTLTDGEPADPDEARRIIRVLKLSNIKMAAIGLGSNTLHAITIANNLKRLGYEKILAVNNINDITSKILNIIDQK